jgi:hypothetical protein
MAPHRARQFLGPLMGARAVFGGTIARPSGEHARIPDATYKRQEINVVDLSKLPLSTGEKM